MPIELPKAFEPKDVQQKWLKFWDEKKYFHADPAKPGDPYTIVIPPPNVTGALHMGHALNNTLQDVLIRWKRMAGFNTLWMPGTDHAGIATQAVVEKLLLAEDKTFKRREYGREKLVAKIWEWKEKYEARILGQLKEMGASCDWERTAFTFDEPRAKAVRETFFRMFRDGYIYRGKRLVNWDTQLQTSVADDETYTETTKGGFWTFQYEVVGEPGTFIQFSTTRPETMLGDTALCVHPDDPRYQALIGKKVRQPITGREIPIIADGQLADMTLGTGCVKVTPAHDPNDYACWQRNPQIGIINILNPDGTINAAGGKYEGMDRFKVREAIVKEMEALGLFLDKQDREIPLPYSDRSKTPIEPYLSDQWFVKMDDFSSTSPSAGEVGETESNREWGSTNTPPHPPRSAATSPSGGEVKKGLAQLAMDAVTSNKVKFFPERYAKSYLDWLGEKRDWCISRQLWWGHRISVWRVTLHANMYETELKSIRASLERVITEFHSVIDSLANDCGVPGELIAKQSETSPTIFYVAARTEKASTEFEGIFRRRNRNYLTKFGEPVRSVEPYLMASDPRYANEKLLNGLIAVFDDQDEDVLDTWFSSALWPFSTLGWPEQTAELKKYYPTSTLCTSRDIITLWVARMVLMGEYTQNDIPFSEVYIHPKIMDGFGEGMSKSKGNGLDPLDIIDLYGTDAMRYGMVAIATETQDSRLPVVNVCPHCGTQVPVKAEHMYMRTKKLACPSCKQPFRPGGPWTTEDPELKTAKQASDRFEVGRNFANKLWNATRFILMNLEGYTPGPVGWALPTEKTVGSAHPTELAIEDRWIVSRLATTAAAMTKALESYRFAEVARLVYEFAWTEFCDWYIEMSKSRRSDPVCQRVLVGVLDGIVRLVHPIMPFLAESLWEYLGQVAPERGFPTPVKVAESVCIAPWPEYPAVLIDASTEAGIARMQDLIKGVREIRNRYQLEKPKLALSVKCSDAIAKELLPLQPFIVALGNLDKFECGPSAVKPPQAGSIVRPEYEAYIALAGLIDPAAEAKRLEKQLADLKKQIGAMAGKLGNESYVKNAPPEVVADTREKVKELEGQVRVLEANLNELK